MCMLVGVCMYVRKRQRESETHSLRMCLFVGVRTCEGEGGGKEIEEKEENPPELSR